MRKSGLKIPLLLITSLVVGCATNSSQKTEFSSYTSKDFEQRAPASIAPPQSADDALIDHMHVQSKADYHFTMGEAHSLDGNVDKAIESFKLTLVYDNDSPTVRYRLAGEFVKKGFISEAIENAEMVIAKEPEHIEARLLLGNLYTTLKMYKKAQSQYSTVVEVDPKNEEAKLYMGAILIDQEKFKQALRHFDIIAKDKKSKVRQLAYYYKGRIHFRLKKFKKAQKSFESSLEVDPKFVEGVLALGAMYEDQMDRKKAKTLYYTYQDKFGANAKVAEPLGRLYMEDEDYDKAYRQFEIIEMQSTANLGVKVKMALILIEQKKYPKAVVKLNEILREVPDSDKIRFYLGAVYEEIKDYDNAIVQFKMIPLVSSFYVEAVIHGAYLLKLKNKHEDAIAWIDDAIAKRDDAEQLYTLKASLMDDIKQYQEAIQFLLVAEKKFPKNDQIKFFIGSLSDKVGDKNATIKYMLRVLELNTEHIQALNYLAYSYAEIGKKLAVAEKMALKANHLKPNDPYITDTLGWVYFKRGNYKEAVKQLEIAYKLASDQSIIAEHLGDAYYHYELPLKAKWLYQRALELTTSERKRKKLRQKIVTINEGPSNKKALKEANLSKTERQPTSK